MGGFKCLATLPKRDGGVHYLLAHCELLLFDVKTVTTDSHNFELGRLATFVMLFHDTGKTLEDEWQTLLLDKMHGIVE